MEKETGVVAEAALSAFFGVLFDRLASLASTKLLNFVRREGLEAAELDKWSKMLSKIEAVLEDAEEQHDNGRGRKAVKKWLDDLRDLAYDVDDILDELSTNALQQKLMTGGNQASPSQGGKRKRNFFPDLIASAFKVDKGQSSEREENMGLSSEIKEITDRFNDIMKQKDDLKLSETVGERSCRPRQILALTSVVTEAQVYGREEDKEAVLEFLVGKERSDAQLSVLPIIGMGGMGKTTLAQLVYNDEEVQKVFNLKAWACVSEDFDAVRVTKTILQSFTSVACEGMDLSWLQEKLKANLKGKKFLVVLDDLWNEEYSDWTILRAPFEAGAPGSMILITTRNQGVSSATGTIPAYNLKELSDDFCLSILAHHALNKRDFSAHLNLKDIGEEIVRRCKGSPLAAKVLGGVLRNKVDLDEWEDVLNSNIWNITEVKNEIAPALMLSYHHLPSHLKRCFAYCSILPKDYEFEEKQLVLLWMAEGLLQPREERKQMVDLGREYFRNLYSRSFFQQSFKDESRYVMHDLINDLAQQVAGNICFRMEHRVGGNNDRKPSRKARHSSYLGSTCDGIQKFEVFKDLTCLRTFLPLMLPHSYCMLTRNVPFELLPRLRRLRVLSLNGYQIHELPKSIGHDLKHLRFLDLSWTRISSLPESVGTLYNLQTLILESCFYLKKLPSTFGNLVNLRHLNIRGANALEGMPQQIGKLTCLQSLSNLVVGKDSCSGLKELGPLLNLQETLCISRLENVIDYADAREARLSEKKNLNGLSLEWSEYLNESQDSTSELLVLSMLKPHEGLKEFTVKNYSGSEFPTWLGVPSFSKMVLLKIESCSKCTLLPPVGQLPSLKELFIKGMASVKNIGSEFFGKGCLQPFRSLETLHFNDMREWVNWIPCEEFPKLRKLSITWCPKLMGKLPNQLPLLENIVIDGCRQLVVSISSFPELCKLEIGGSEGVVRGNKVDFNSLRFSLPSTILEFPCQIEEFIMGGLTNVKDLTVKQCEELTTLLFNDVGLLQHLPCLEVLEIYNCSKLLSLVAAEVEEPLQLSLPSKLRKISIAFCGVLKSLPKAMMHNNTCLEEIYISDCHLLTHFAIGQLPPTLKRLKIQSCRNMQYLTSSEELPATLRYLEICVCQKLESIAKSFGHNSSLEAIRISNCVNLKSLPMGIHNLSHLDRIFITGCPTLDSFSDEVLLPTNLKVLSIFECEKMQAMPNCVPNLTSLQKLSISPPPSILSFPEGGFPINLTSLTIKIEVSSNEEWGLYKLTSLKKLEIDGRSWQPVSFPEMMLPASLTSLSIEDFPNLECMSSKSFQILASLEELSINGCEKLTSFLVDGLPLSLKRLTIGFCKKFTMDALPPSLARLAIHRCKNLTSFPLPPSLKSLYISVYEKLTSFPENGLPLSLLELEIIYCPQLTERCKGQEWFKIAHIPSVRIDSAPFYKLEEENQ